MSDSKSGEKPSDIARNIWLAGLGAYGRALKDAQGRLEEAAKEPPRLFKELVEKGTKLDAEVRDSLANIRKSGGMSVEERIQRVRETFNFSLGRGDELTAINHKLDTLIARVDELAAQVNAKPAKKTARKTPARKTKSKAAKKATKSPAKKPARKAPRKAAAKRKTPRRKA